MSDGTKAPRVYRNKTVREKLDGASQSMLYRLMADAGFPRPAKLGDTATNIWNADEVDAWITAQFSRQARAA